MLHMSQYLAVVISKGQKLLIQLLTDGCDVTTELGRVL